MGRFSILFFGFVKMVVGVVVVDFIAEDKCVPAHLVSPNFSSSSLDSQQQGKRAS